MNSYIKNSTVKRIWSSICIAGITSIFLILKIYGAELTGEKQAQTEINWEENYTDTDSEKGILAVRCQAFQGFQGIVSASVVQSGSGRAYSVLLEPDNGYTQNLELPVGNYYLNSIEAVSENRLFACINQPEEFFIGINEVSVCRILVEPDSRILFPEEDVVATPPETDQTETKQPRLASAADPSAAAETENKEALSDLSVDMEKRRNDEILLFPGLLGMAGFTVWLIWLWKRR